MNTVTQYIKKFMSESQERKDPVSLEIDKIRDLINKDEGSEFAIHVELTDEFPDSIDPVSGGLRSHVASEDADGYLSIEKTDDGTWSWQTVISSETDSFALDDSKKGFASLEECLSSVQNYANSLDVFEVIGLV